VSAETSVEAGVFGTLKAKLSGGLRGGSTVREELVVTAPTDQGLLKVMAEAGVILAIDEMHKASDGFRLQLAEMLKAASNLGRGYPKVAIVGTTADASELVRQDAVSIG
jgi:superfamily II DNA helicase RecQ